MTALVENNLFPHIMARHGSQDRSRDEESASDLDVMNELLYAQGYQGISFPQMDPLPDRHTGSPWEGQQNFHSHSGENGTTDSYESVPMSRTSHGGAVSGIDAQSFSLDNSGSWSTQDSSMGTILERWISQSSREVIGSPRASVRTVTPDHPIKAQSVELCQSLSQMSHHSGITDRSFSLPDTGLYPSSLNYTDNQLYSESKYIDEMDSSVGHGSYHNGDAKISSRRPSHLIPVTAGSSYPPYTSPEEVMFTSPMDVMSQAMFEPSISHDGVSAAMDPLNINDSLWAWDAIDQPESGGSTPFSTDMAWSAGATTKNTMGYSPNRTTNSPRTNRKATVQQNGRVAGDQSVNYQPGFYDGLQADRSHSHGSVDNDNTPREHPLYQKATTGPDGLYHCPWEGKDPLCNHKPEKLKCNYDKFVDSHLKPYRCKVHACENARFSSTACLLRHEREAHAMHGHGEKPFLCTFENCERGVLGNGFPRHWNLCDHMKRVHNRSPSPPAGSTKPQRGSKKRKNSTGETSTSKKSPTTGSAAVEKPRAPVRSLSLSEQYQNANKQLVSELLDMPDLGDVEAAEQKIEKATNYLKQMARATQQMKSVPRMERTTSQQSS